MTVDMLFQKLEELRKHNLGGKEVKFIIPDKAWVGQQEFPIAIVEEDDNCGGEKGFIALRPQG